MANGGLTVNQFGIAASSAGRTRCLSGYWRTSARRPSATCLSALAWRCIRGSGKYWTGTTFAKSTTRSSLFTKTETGFAAIGPQHIRKGLDSAAERAFIAQEGRVPTPEEKNNISVDPKVLRNVLESLELVGYCIRTNDDGVPLAELKGQTIRMSGGKLVSATKILSGENKIRVFLFLRPRPPKIRQEVPEKRVPQELNNRELKPLYVLIRGLKLDIEPVALAADTDLQATIRADMDAREAFNKQRDEALVKAILERYPSAQISAPNSNGKGQLSVGSPNPRSRNDALPPDGADSSMGTEDELVSQPRQRAPSPPIPQRPLRPLVYRWARRTPRLRGLHLRTGMEAALFQRQIGTR
jgi:hypothetical protein